MLVKSFALPRALPLNVTFASLSYGSAEKLELVISLTAKFSIAKVVFPSPSIVIVLSAAAKTSRIIIKK